MVETDAGPVTYELEQGAEWRFELQEPGEAIAVRVSTVVQALRDTACGTRYAQMHCSGLIFLLTDSAFALCSVDH